MGEKHLQLEPFTDQRIENIPVVSEVLKKKYFKNKKEELKITYECVGTAEENQDILDRVFDRIFEKVIERRQGKRGY